MSTFREKYLKYKMKYIQLKKQLGGACNCARNHSSIADCPVCRNAMPAAVGNAVPAAMGNAVPAVAGDINVTVVSMSGNNDIFPISPNATILELKRRIQANNKLEYLEIYRQRLMYRPGPHGIEPLANDLTLAECGIQQIGEKPIEVDLLLEDDLLEFNLENNNELRGRIIGLLRNSHTDELKKLLSQYVGHLQIRESHSGPQLDFDPASRWLRTLANALRENITVTHLDIRSSGFLDEDFTSLTDTLKEDTNINLVELIFMNLGDNHISALAEALKVNRNITTVNLLGNNIGNDGAIALAEALKSNNTITVIILAGNRILENGALALVIALTENITVTRLDIDSNWFHSDGIVRYAFQDLQDGRQGLEINI